MSLRIEHQTLAVLLFLLSFAVESSPLPIRNEELDSVANDVSLISDTSNKECSGTIPSLFLLDTIKIPGIWVSDIGRSNTNKIYEVRSIAYVNL